MQYTNPNQRMMMEEGENFRLNQRELLSAKAVSNITSCVSVFNVEPNISDWTNTIIIQFNRLEGISSVIVYRGTSSDVAAATVLATYDPAGMMPGEKITLVDSDMAVADQDLNFWLKLISNKTTVQPVVLGPINTKAHRVDTIPPMPATEFYASKSAAQDGIVEVSVAAKKPNDPRFAGFRIYAVDYRQDFYPVLIADSRFSPFSFPMDRTGETVTLKCVTVNENGNEGTELVCSLALNTSATAPNKLIDVTITSQLGGVQIDFTGGAESYITSYEVRRQKMDGSADTLVENVPVSLGNLHYTVVDADGYADKFCYYVIAKSPAGDSVASDFVSVVSLAEIPGTAADIRYNSGKTVEELMPAEAGADVAKPLAQAAQDKADQAYANASAAQTDASSALSKLTDIASDSALTPDEKPSVLLDYNTLVNEQAGIDAQATTFAITTEKTTYDNAIAALVSYMATLTTPVLWSNLTDKTTIAGATFRQKFQDSYIARQALLNAMYAKAKSLAETSPVDASRVAFQLGGGNLLRQSNFETDSNGDGYADGWASYTGIQPGSPALDTGAFYGSKCQTFKAVGGNNSPRIQSLNRPYAPAGNKVVVTAWMRGLVGTSLYLSCKAALSLGGGENATYQSVSVPATGLWQRVKIPVFTTTVEAGEYLIVMPGMTNMPAAGTQVWIDAVKVEVGDVETSYSLNVDEVNDAAVLAQSSATSALAQLTDIVSDNYLTPDEKPSVIQDYNVITNEQAGIDEQAGIFGVTTERTSYDNAITALTNYLATLTTPKPWNDLTDKTVIVGTTFRQKFQDVYVARQALLNSVASRIATMNDQAMEQANTATDTANYASDNAQAASVSAAQALSQLSDIANDNVLTPVEKSAVILDWNTINTERAGIDAQATSFGITTEKTAYDAAVDALSTYLVALTPSWSDTSISTPINGATFRLKFQDVYTKRQVLLNMIYAAAKALANGAQSTADTALSNTTTIGNKVVYLNSSGYFTASTGLNGLGSLAPSQLIIINYTVYSDSVVLSWASQSLLRSDGSTFTLAAGSITYTGLSASTTYYVYPYIRVSDFTLQFSNPTPPQTTPSATYAMYSALDGRIPVPVMKLTTPTSGSSGGTGGGGDLCPEAEEIVTVEGKGQIRAIQVEVEDRILGKSFQTGEDVYRRVIARSTQSSRAWRMVNGHRVSPCEPVWADGAWTPAFKVAGSTFDGFNGTKVNLTVEGDDYNESNFYLSSGTPLLIHNRPADYVC